MTDNTSYEFSYNVDSSLHEVWEDPSYVSAETVPLDIFSHASTMQALVRYLVDERQLTFTQTSHLLQRSVKSTWTSYHQTPPLPQPNEQSLRIPTSIFSEGLPPLEALVRHLRREGFRNIDIAHALGLSPKTTHTAWKRSEVKQ